MACTSLKVNVKQKWYFDSGSSRHMTGNKEFLTNLQPCNLESITFGDGAKGTVISSSLSKVPGMPKLENVLMNGLKINLISINQQCNKNLFVKFTKKKFLVTDSTNTCLMEGKRSSDNCYLLICSRTCCTTLLKNSDIRHRRLDHISHKNVNETIATDAVMGIPKMKIDLEKVCGPCQIKKQIRMSHNMIQHPSTTRVLELIQINLMGPMQVERIGGKRYVFVCVDDYSILS